MIDRVIKFIREKNMLLPNDRVVVGVSGGADSVCLLHMLLEVSRVIPIKLYVVHIEHGIRGEESIKDAKYVEELSKKYNLPFKIYSYDVEKEAMKNRLGTEEMGRILRYRAFEEVSIEVSTEALGKPYREIEAEFGVKIAVAHNKNDTVETTLINLFRGSGLKGLTGIPATRDNIIRPLMCLERVEIEQWLEEKNIQYRNDATNFEDDYTRNKIRLNVLPYVRDNINSKVVSNIDNASKLLTEAYSYIETQSISTYNKCVDENDKKISIKLREFNEEADIIKKNIVMKCIEKISKSLKDIGNVHIESVLSLVPNNTGKEVNLPYQITAKRSYQSIDIFHDSNVKKIKHTEIIAKEVIEISVPGICIYCGYEFEFSLEKNKKDKNIPEKMYTKWFDYDKIKGTLRLRTRETGDYIEVNSLGQNKKLKSYFIDEKIERNVRDDISLLCDDNHVIWIVGHRISEGYKVTDNTENILKIHVLTGGKNNVR